jgi:hypothetical protein
MRRLIAFLILLSLVFAPGAFAWSWPVDGALLRPFSLGDDPYAGGQHRGIDIAADVGGNVRAPAAGTVSFVGSVPNGGRAVTIRTGDGYAVTLLQLEAASVEEGAQIGEGDSLGTVGESRDSVTKAPHVHLGIRVAADEHGYVDPLSLLPSRAAPPEPARAATPPAVEPATVPAPAAPAAEAAPPVAVAPPPAPSTAPAQAPAPPVVQPTPLAAPATTVTPPRAVPAPAAPAERTAAPEVMGARAPPRPSSRSSSMPSRPLGRAK